MFVIVNIYHGAASITAQECGTNGWCPCEVSSVPLFLFVASTSQIPGTGQWTVARMRNSMCRINFKHVKCISRGSKIITYFRDAFRKKTLSK